MTNKVFVVNHSGHNIRIAEKYGEIHILSKGKVNIFQTDRLQCEFASILKDFTSEDYLLLSGSPVLNIIATLVAFCVSPLVQVLIYNVKSLEYEIRTLSLENIKQVVKEVINGEFTYDE